MSALLRQETAEPANSGTSRSENVSAMKKFAEITNSGVATIASANALTPIPTARALVKTTTGALKSANASQLVEHALIHSAFTTSLLATASAELMFAVTTRSSTPSSASANASVSVQARVNDCKCTCDELV